MIKSSKNLFLLLALCLFTMNLHAQTLYAISGAGENTPSYLYELNPLTGDTVRTIGYTGYSGIAGIAIHPKTGVMYGHKNGVVYDEDDFPDGPPRGDQNPDMIPGLLLQIDKTTGVATPIGSTGLQSPDLAFDSSGTLYAWFEVNFDNYNYDNIATLNLTTGEATEVDDYYHETYATGITFSSSNQCYMKDGDSVYAFNHTNGTKSAGVALSGTTNNLLARNKQGVFYTGERNQGFILKTLDVSTGQLSTVGSVAVNHISAIEFDISGNPCAPIVNITSITHPSNGQANGSITPGLTFPCSSDTIVRYARWTKKGGKDYPAGNDFILNNAEAGEYTLVIILPNQEPFYYGPYVLTNR